MAFSGWPAGAITFYEGLEADNSKAYWQAHKDEYRDLVEGPMEALLAELAGEFGAGKVFRPYRDVRFSADKTPYKTAIGATLEAGAYVHMSADGLGLGRGYWMMAADQLERYRSAVDAEATGTALVKLSSAITKKGIEVTGHDVLKTAPRGYAKDHPRVDLLRNKGLTASRHHDAGPWLATAKAKTRVVEFFRAAAPLQEWLDVNVGPSTSDTSGRHR